MSHSDRHNKDFFTPPLFGFSILPHKILLMNITNFVWILTILIIPLNCLGYDLFLENENNVKLQKLIKKGDIVWLGSNPAEKFMGIFSRAISTSIKGGCIIMGEPNQHPNWKTVVYPLRTELPKFGWATLSIQPPMSSSPNSMEEKKSIAELVQKRLDTAHDYLTQKKLQNICIISHGQSANIATSYISSRQKNKSSITAAVLISSYDDKLRSTSQNIEKIDINILDIYAENDWKSVIESSQRRATAAKLAATLMRRQPPIPFSTKAQEITIQKIGNLRYRQKMINGTNHQFIAQQDYLVKYIRGWLANYGTDFR